MRIKELYLKNYRCFEEAKITFPEDCRTVGFIGRNGAGKSSILDAIFIALYGLGSKGTGKRMEEVIRNGRGRAYIFLTFEYGGNTYRIERTFERVVSGGKESKRSSCVLYRIENGKMRKICDNSEKLLKWVSENIGPPDVFRAAIYVQQNEITRILDSPEELARFFMSYLGLERWSNALNNVNLLAHHIREKRERIKGALETLQKDVEDDKRKIEEGRKKLKILEEEIKTLEKEVDKLNKEKEKLDLAKEYLETISKLREKERIKEALERNRKSLLERAADLRKKLDELKSLEEERVEEKLKEAEEVLEKLEKLEDEERGIKRDLERMRGEINEREARIREMIDKRDSINNILPASASTLSEEELERELLESLSRVEKYERELLHIRKNYGESFLKEVLSKVGKEKELEDEIRKLEDKLKEVERDRAIISSAIENLQESTKKLSEGKGRCPLCKAELTEERKKMLINEYLQRVKELQERLKTLENEKKELERKIGEVKTIRDVLLRTSNLIKEGEAAKEFLEEIGGKEQALKILDLLKDIQGLTHEEKELKNLKETLETIENRLKEISQEIQKVLSGKDLEKLKEEREVLRVKVQKLQMLREEDPERGLKSVEEGIKEAEEEAKKVEEELKRLKGEIEELQSSLMKLGISPEELDKLEVETQTLEVEKKLKEKERELSSKKGKLEGLKEEIEKLESDLERKRRALLKKKELKEGLEKLEKYVSEIREKLSQILEKAINTAIWTVQDNTNKIFQEFTEKNYIVELIPKSSGREIRVDRIIVRVRYGNLENVLSGGERVALALALRSAMAKIMSLTKKGGSELLLMLDEPTINLDQQNRERLSVLLERYLGRLRQVIVVSHNTELLKSLKRKYRVIYDEERGVSKVVVEEE